MVIRNPQKGDNDNFCLHPWESGRQKRDNTSAIKMLHQILVWVSVWAMFRKPQPLLALSKKVRQYFLQFVRQYAPHLYGSTFLASKLRRKGSPAIHLPFVLQYASHLYGSTPPICAAVLLEKYWGLGSPERF